MIELRNFKNFPKARFDETKGVSLMVGPNGSGKSNFIEGIELLSFLVAGNPLHGVTDIGREGGIEIRGGLDACPGFGSRTFSFSVEKDLKISGRHKKVLYELKVRTGVEPRIVGEQMAVAGDKIPFFEILPSDARGYAVSNRVRYNNHDKGRNKPTVGATPNQSVISQYSRLATGDKRLSETLETINAFIASMAPPAVFDPLPRLMREYERTSDSPLARNGSNISAVIEWLHRKEQSRRGKKNGLGSAKCILDRIGQLPDEPFFDFDFVETPEGDVLLGFRTKHEKRPITAKVLSDGTLRALAIFAALESCSPGQSVILEEFDNGVHPSRVHLLTGALFEVAKRRNLRILATTHNPATMNSLSDEQLESVLLLLGTGGKSQLIQIPELPGWIEFIESGRLGDLITRRAYTRHLSPAYENERTEVIQKWLEEIPS